MFLEIKNHIDAELHRYVVPLRTRYSISSKAALSAFARTSSFRQKESIDELLDNPEAKIGLNLEE